MTDHEPKGRRGPKQGSTALSRLDKDEAKIRRMARLGYTIKEVAKEIGCWEGTLANYRTRKGIQFRDGRGRHTGARLRDPDQLASQLARLNARYEGTQPSPKWESSKRRKALTKVAFKMVRMDTWMEMTTGTAMEAAVAKERQVHYRLALGQHLTSFELLI